MLSGSIQLLYIHDEWISFRIVRCTEWWKEWWKKLLWEPSVDTAEISSEFRVVSASLFFEKWSMIDVLFSINKGIRSFNRASQAHWYFYSSIALYSISRWNSGERSLNNKRGVTLQKNRRISISRLVTTFLWTILSSSGRSFQWVSSSFWIFKCGAADDLSSNDSSL